MEPEKAFTFPTHMPRDAAQELLAQAYADLNEGRVLRRALARQRDAGLDPPSDVQYVSEPRLAVYPDGLGVAVTSDVLVHEEFEGADECVRIFEDTLGEDLIRRLEKRVRGWVKTHPDSRPSTGPR